MNGPEIDPFLDGDASVRADAWRARAERAERGQERLRGFIRIVRDWYGLPPDLQRHAEAILAETKS